jgi:hypothetical protein
MSKEMSKKSRQTRRQRIARNLKRSGRALQVERLEVRNLLNADFNPMHNPALPGDVNEDGFITPADALIIINKLHAGDTYAEGEPGGNSQSSSRSQMKYDTNDDGEVTPGDVRLVANRLNAEGENGVVLNVITRIFERPIDYPFDSSGNRVEATNEITEIGVGQDFVVKLLVEDVRTMSTRSGVFSVYVDVNFDNPAVASVVESLPGVIHPNPNLGGISTPYLHNTSPFSFGYGSAAQPTAGLSLIDTDNNGSLDQIDLIGSFAPSLSRPGPGEFVLVEWAMTANSAGSLTIIAEPTTEDVAIDPNDANQSPLFDAGLYDQDPSVCPSLSPDPCMGDMGFISDTITVVEKVTAKPDGFVVAEDVMGGTTLNVLANDEINTEGMLTISNPLGTPSMGGTVVNNGTNITYTSAPDFFGTETFTYTITNGLGDSSSTTVTVEVTPVNDDPIISVPGSQTIDEDNDLVFSGGTLSVSDVDADAGSGLQVDLAVGNGSLTVGATSATVTNDGTASVGISGSVADVNAALNGLTYTPTLHFNGSDSLSFNVTDNGSFGAGGPKTDSDTVTISINPVNDAPINTVPGPQTVFNTESLAFGSGAFQVSDVDATDLEVTLSVGQGTLSLSTTSGLQISGNNSTSLTATGSISNLNNGLGSLVYDPVDTFNGTVTLSLTANDLGASGAGGAMSDTDTVTITVTPPEVPFAAGDMYTIEEGSSSTNLDVLVNDIRPMPSQDNTLTITQLNGAAINSGEQMTSGNGGTITFNGSNFSYIPATDFFGTDTFTYTIESTPDAGDGPSIGTVSIEVQGINDAPINSVPGPLSIDEDNSLSFSGGNSISVVDIDAGSDDITVTLTVGDGTLNVAGSGGTVSNNDSGTVTLDGTVAQVNSQLGSLTYTPNAHFFGSDTLIVNTNDNGNTGGVTGSPNSSNPLVDSDSVVITIQPINDGPVIVVPGNQTFITNFDNFLSDARGNALSISDVDAGNDDVQVDLTIGEGTLTLSDTSSLSSITGNGSGSLRLMGSVLDINTALGAGVNYRTSLEGDKTLAVTVNDLGNNGGIAGDPSANNPLSASANIAVTVIDFVPSEIGGSVFVDLDNDSNRGDAEPGLATIEITLDGTTLRGTPVALTTFTNQNGQYLFENLEPGNYVLNQPNQPANMNNGTNSFSTAVVAAENDRANVTIPIAGDMHSLQNNYAERGLSSPFISMYDLAASQFQRSGALLSTDGLTSWTAFFGPGWDNYSNPRVDLVTMMLTVTDGSGTDRNVDLRASDPNRHGRTQMDRVTVRTRDDNQVIRLSGSAADFGLAAEGEGEGEGDLADVQGTDSSEMFAQAVDRIFGEMA